MHRTSVSTEHIPTSIPTSITTFISIPPLLPPLLHLYPHPPVQPLDPRHVQVNLTGFLGDGAAHFMAALWNVLTAAQENGGVPHEAIEAEKRRLERERLQPKVWRLFHSFIHSLICLFVHLFAHSFDLSIFFLL